LHKQTIIKTKTMMSYGKGSKTATSNGPGKGTKTTSTLKRTLKDVPVKKSVAGADTAKPKAAPLPINDNSDRAYRMRKGKDAAFKATASPAATSPAAIKERERKLSENKRKAEELNREMNARRSQVRSTTTPAPARRRP
jgi:hypothetical protein